MMTGMIVPVITASAQEAGTIGIRLVDAPVERKDDPRARVYIVDHVQPGSTFSRRIEVANNSASGLTPTLYASAARIEDGAFVGGDDGSSNVLTEWISIEPATLELEPGGRATATVTIAVPQDAPAGEFYGAVWAEVGRPGGANDPVQVRNRAGVRIYLSVGGEQEPPTDFELPAFRPIRTDDNRPAIEIDACNTGGRAIDLTGEVELSDGPGGVKAGPFATEGATTLAPEQCDTFTIVLDPELPSGPWDATARLESGEEERTAQARITFPEEPGERGEKVETREVTGTVPGIIALGVSVFLLLLLGGWLAWFLLKRRARKRDEDEERD